MTRSILVIDESNAAYYRDRLLEKFPEVRFHLARNKDEVGDVVREVEAIWGLGLPTVFGDELFRAASRLKWVQALTTGTDLILAMPSLRKDVVVTSMRGIHGPQMSELAFLLMVGLARDLPRMLRNQRKAVWDRFEQARLYGKTVAIVGVGIIGGDLALRCKACGMRVIGVTRTPRAVDGIDDMMSYGQLEQAAKQADFLVGIAPYSRETHGMVDARLIEAMKPSAFLINIGRGGVVDEDALLQALRDKRIAGAALDVFENEPLPPEHPFWREPRMIVTPHMGGLTDFAPALHMETLGTNLRCFLEGRLSEMVNIVR